MPKATLAWIVHGINVSDPELGRKRSFQIANSAKTNTQPAIHSYTESATENVFDEKIQAFGE